MAAAQGRIFISYRRQDTAWPARQLYEAMVGRFGTSNVFKDVDDINPGDDFVEQIAGAVAQCNVLLALIGPQWLTVQDPTGRRRIDDPDDFVRLEIAAALSRGIRVVPILIDGAPMPSPQELPADLAALTRRQAVSIDPVSFSTDRLFATLAETLKPPAPPPLPPKPRPAKPIGEPGNPQRTGILLGAGAVALLLIAGLFVWRPWVSVYTATNAPVTSTPASPSRPGASPSEIVSEPRGGPLAIMAHRGGHERHQLETMQAMEAAAREGFSVETDVRYTADRVAVMVHDEEATKGLDCGGQDIKVAQTTWKVLKATCRSKPTAQDPKSYQIPTFALTMESIAAASPNAWVFPEIKNDLSLAQTKEFLAVLSDAGMRERSVVTSFTPARLERVKQADPDQPTLLMMNKEPVPVSELTELGVWGVGVDQSLANAAYIEQLKAANLRVMVWLLNDTKQWAAASSLGADVVMTDFPEKYRAWK
ncbi:MAG: TIR domain-containing protein, partial [Micropruina sp.]|nr:TIR domain-containing protein [Micropruina sp.]